MKKLISVIIPCFNVEKYIDRCLGSIVNQSIGLDNLEIIVVNDASTDNTLIKLQQWEKKYPNNITVITYGENIRQGGARNIGLQYATGEYIGFVDSDDWIEKDMYLTLHRYMKTGKYDVVKCKFARDTSSGFAQFSVSKEGENHEEFFCCEKGFFWAEPVSKGLIGEYGGIYTGLYKRSLIMDNSVFFPEHMAYEDNYWGSILKLYTSSIYIVDYPFYHYFVNDSSTTTSRNVTHQLDRIDIEEMIIEKYIELGAFDLYYDRIVPEFIERYYLNTLFIVFTRFDYVPDIYNRMRNTIYQYFHDWYLIYDFNSISNPRAILLLWLMEHPTSTPKELLRLKMDYLVALNAQNKK